MKRESNRWTQQRVKAVALEVCSKLEMFEKVYQRGKKLVVRYPSDLSHTVIVKLFARPGFKTMMRRSVGFSTSVDYEWRGLERARSLGIRAPEPLGYSRLPKNESPYIDAIVMEDLGACETAANYIGSLIDTEDDSALEDFEDKVIEMTYILVSSGALDSDHTFHNIVVKERSKEPVRLDLELMRSNAYPAINVMLYARTIGRLVASYTFAVQPDTQRVVRFSNRLVNRLRPPAITLKMAKYVLKNALFIQKIRHGIAIEVPLDW